MLLDNVAELIVDLMERVWNIMEHVPPPHGHLEYRFYTIYALSYVYNNTSTAMQHINRSHNVTSPHLKVI